VGSWCSVLLTLDRVSNLESWQKLCGHGVVVGDGGFVNMVVGGVLLSEVRRRNNRFVCVDGLFSFF
jgi:hypothetical protein